MPTKKSNQPNYIKDLILLFAVPVAVVVFAAAIIYIPRLLANPQYNFVYSICSGYDCDTDFTVNSSGNVVQHTVNRDYSYSNDLAYLRIYDVKTDSSRVLDLDDAKNYKLDTSSKSPDGYSLTQEESGSSGFLLWGSSRNEGWYLKDGLKKKEVELSSTNSDYSTDINFLGWVLK